MAVPQLEVWISMALTALAAVLYLMLARRLGRRQLDPDASLANHAWQAWWGLLAASSLIGIGNTLLWLAGWYSLPVALTSLMVNLVVIFTALWGLSYYLLYLVSGKTWLWRPTAAFYATSTILWIYTIFRAQPTGITSAGGQATIEYLTPLTAQPLYVPLFLGLLVPSMAAAAAYGYLAVQAPDRTVRFRILLVSTAIILWFGASLIASAIGINDWQYWPLMSRIISLSAAGAVYVAHFPPAWVAAKLDLRPADRHA